MAGAPTKFHPGCVNYDGAHSANYPRARALSAEAAEAWRRAIEPYVPARDDLRILDLGAGAGRFAERFVRWFGARVLAVEPAAGMRAQAAILAKTGGFALVGGAGEHVPVRDGCCDVVWLSHVLHHVGDRPRCAREVGRILRGAGRVLICAGFAGRLDDITLFRYFPGAKRVTDDFPTLEDTIETFAAAGLRFDALQRVTQQTCSNLREMAERTRLRADTTLELLPDEEFAACQAALERAAAAEAVPTPVHDTLDLLVLHPT